MDALFDLIDQKKATVALVGLGHTGLFLANEYRKAGLSLIGYDIDKEKIEKLKKKENYLPFFSPDALFGSLNKEFIPTHDPSLLAKADAIIIAVPTPLDLQRMPNLKPLLSAAKTVAESLRKGQLIVMQTTSFPGTVEEYLLPIFAAKNLKVGKDFFLAHVPEREDPGNANLILSHVPRLAGGVTPECLRLTKRLYEHITDKVVPCSSVKIAEMTKVFENTYRLINIAFVNEMKIALDKMGIDCWEMIDMASTKPFGYTPFYPGPGIGGECIPVDPLYFAWKANQYEAQTDMIDVASDVNIKTSAYVVHKISLALNERKKAVKDSRILILGVAFKKNLSDIRESPAIRIIQQLKDQGAEVSYTDPYVPELSQFNLHSISLDEKTLKQSDCIVVVTDHDQFDWKTICENGSLIVDTRHATKGLKGFEKKIVL